jgi:hypothetical protein
MGRSEKELRRGLIAVTLTKPWRLPEWPSIGGYHAKRHYEAIAEAMQEVHPSAV